MDKTNKQIKEKLQQQGYNIIEPEPTLIEVIKQLWFIKLVRSIRR